MPSGEVHLRLYKRNSIWILPLLGTGAYIASNDLPFSIMSLLGYGLGYYVSPDLDLIGLNSDEGRMMRHFPIVGHLMVAWWFLYAGICQMFGGHRSRFSHGYLVGTLFRLLWMFIPIVYIWTRLTFVWDVSTEEFILKIFLPLWIGLSAADAIHIAADFSS